MNGRWTRNNERHGERGQVLALTALFSIVILMFVGVVVDGGNAFVKRRDLQGNADAAALAGAALLDQSDGRARQTAREYVIDNNPQDAARVDKIETEDESNSITVRVRRQTPGIFSGLFTDGTPTIRATATAEMAYMSASASNGMLPMALMRGSYTVGENVNVKFDGNATGNRGAISPDQNPPHCVISSGANDFKNIIMSEAHGGIDACAYEIGDTVQTETGNMSGPTQSGFDSRIPSSNHDSFNDLFSYDAQTGRWSVNDMSNPRVGIVPVTENTDGSTNWPGGSKDIRILGYMLVYIGKTDESGYPPYTNNGKDVWITPVRALLPSQFGEITSHSPHFEDQPVAIHLTN